MILHRYHEEMNTGLNMKRAVCLLLTVFLTSAGRSSSIRSGSPVPAPDRSLDTAAYISKGLPAPDRDWGGDDYGRALAVLQALGNEDAYSLPRRFSPRSKDVFACMVSDSNLDIAHSTSLPVGLRLRQSLAEFDATGKILSVYAGPTTPAATFDDELVDLMATLLRQAVSTCQLLDEFLQTLPPAERSTPARTEGFAQVRQGMANVVSGALTTLTESALYRVPPRVRLAQALAKHLPDLYSYIPTGTQQEVRVRLVKLATDAEDSELKEAVTSISKSLERRVAEPQAVRPWKQERRER
ncbi:MAG TPA: hypothetical protein VJA66_17310 [Thermoanaerobaculia bacterium]